jgi:hypothetical protein
MSMAKRKGKPEGPRTPWIFFHRTTRVAALQILDDGFQDGTGYYLTDRKHRGVWLSDRPLDINEEARGDELLAVVIGLSDAEVTEYEWVEEGKTYREWLFPAEILNVRASVFRVTEWESDMDFERKVAELKAELEKLPADRREQFERELNRDAGSARRDETGKV